MVPYVMFGLNCVPASRRGSGFEELLDIELEELELDETGAASPFMQRTVA
jgi:hypothetical protein